MTVFEVEGSAYLVLLLAMLAVKGFVLVSAALYPAAAYPAADKGSKAAWTIGLGIGFAAQVLMMGSSPLNLIHLAFTIAAFVYLADVRPALAQVTSRR